MGLFFYLIVTTVLVVIAFIIGLSFANVEEDKKGKKANKSSNQKPDDDSDSSGDELKSVRSDSIDSKQMNKNPPKDSNKRTKESKTKVKYSDKPSKGEDSSGDELLGSYRDYSSNTYKKLKKYEKPGENGDNIKHYKTKTNIKVKSKNERQNSEDFVDVDLMSV